MMVGMIDLDLLWHDYLGISWTGAAGVVLSTIVLYLFFSLLVHLSGTRLMATMSTASFVVLAVVGGVSARSMLGESPTMIGALLVLNTLMVMEALMGTFRRLVPVLPAAMRRRPSVVMLEGRSRAESLRRRRLTEAGLHDRLRIGGVLDPAEVELVILEERGGLTIVRRGERIAPALLADVEGAELVPERLLAGG